MHVILILLVMLANYTFAFAEISEPMTINIIENPANNTSFVVIIENN